MFDILIFSIGSLSQNTRLPLYKLNADGDNIDSTKNQQKTPKKQHSHDQSIIIHREISFFYGYEGYYQNLENTFNKQPPALIIDYIRFIICINYLYYDFDQCKLAGVGV